MSRFGELLRAHRERVGETRRGLGYLASVDPSYATRLERGLKQPGRPVVEMLARGLKLDDTQTHELLAAAGYWPWSVGWNSDIECAAYPRPRLCATP